MESEMSVAELNELSVNIERSSKMIIKKFNKLLLEDHTKQVLNQGEELINFGTKLLNTLKTTAKNLETLLVDCREFIDDIEADLSTEQKEDFVHHTKNGMLTYPGREIISKILKATPVKVPVNNSHTSTKPTTTTVQKVINITEINYNMTMPVVEKLSDIPNAFHYFKGSTENPAGVYMQINNNIMRIPFPDVIDSKKEYDRSHSIRCKYLTKTECDAQRNKMAKLYNSQTRMCNFAHAGDSIVKIGYPSRCPSLPAYGTPATMPEDIRRITLNDVKNLLLYGLSDIMDSIIWLDYNKKNGMIFDKLESA